MAKILSINFTKSDCYLLCEVIEYILGEKALRQEIFHSLGCNIGGGDFPLLHYCDNINCNLYHIMGQYTLWQELIHTRKALDKAKWWLHEIVESHRCTPISTAEMALKEITALEQKDVK